MLYYVTFASDNSRGYLASWGRELQARFQLVTYDDVVDRKNLPHGTYIFTRLEFLRSSALRRAKQLADRLAANPNCRVVNDPNRYVGRFALLRSLHRQGIHRHNVHRPWHLQRIERFPVFVRSGYRHSGSLTPLIYSKTALARALVNPRIIRRAGGDLIIAEYADTTDTDGLHCKFGAYRVGHAVVPHHFYRSGHWVVKGGVDEPIKSDSDAISENLRYIEQNPHREFVMEVFETSGVEYGRLDYAITKMVRSRSR